MKQHEGVVSTRTMDIVMAALLAIVGAVVMFDSARVGNAWGDDGPEAGYFPFYVGCIIVASSLFTLVKAVRDKSGGSSAFVDAGALRSVLQVLIPAGIFVALITWLGLYVSAAIYIAFFMAWLGRYKAQWILPVAIGVPFALFVLFDVWFLVPLPKGPLEAALGY